MSDLESYNAWSIAASDEVKPTNGALIQYWNRRESKAKVMLRMSIKDNIIPHTRNCDTYKESWDMLKGVYETPHANQVLFFKLNCCQLRWKLMKG